MSACAIVAWGAVSALGEGEQALGVGRIGEPARTAVARDAELEAAGLGRPFVARAPLAMADGDGDGDRATRLFARALGGCEAGLDDAIPGWRELRVGLAIGTSSGGMRAFERAGGIGGTYLGPVLAAARPCAFEPFSLVLGACASSSLAIGLAREWLRRGACDVALAGGFDAVSVFVASGFEVLRAVCTERGPRPFRRDRDGLALGEGAAILALVRGDALGALAKRARPFAWVTGFGASADGVHLTAPHPAGAGLARAAARAVADAGAPRIALVSAHGTATDLNDAAEALAIVSVLGPAAPDIPVHALKGAVGHTLGAAGALETLAAAAAMRAGVAPASAGEGIAEPGVALVDRTTAHEASSALKLSSAFGGANAALVVETGPRPAGAVANAGVRATYVSRAVAITGAAIGTATDPRTLAARTGYREDRIARADGLVRLALAAVAKLEDALGPLRGAGIVVGHGLATIDTNALYLARIRQAGARRAEPRRFPYTTPNAVAGECGVAFGLTGPSFAVGGGAHGGLEALAAASALVAGGVADRVVVVAADEAGEASRRLSPGTEPGAVALLVAAEVLAARLEASVVRLAPMPAPMPASSADHAPIGPMHAHRALVPLANDRPESLEVTLPWGGFAKARLFWL